MDSCSTPTGFVLTVHAPTRIVFICIFLYFFIVFFICNLVPVKWSTLYSFVQANLSNKVADLIDRVLATLGPVLFTLFVWCPERTAWNGQSVYRKERGLAGVKKTQPKWGDIGGRLVLEATQLVWRHELRFLGPNMGHQPTVPFDLAYLSLKEEPIKI